MKKVLIPIEKLRVNRDMSPSGKYLYFVHLKLASNIFILKCHSLRHARQIVKHLLMVSEVEYRDKNKISIRDLALPDSI